MKYKIILCASVLLALTISGCATMEETKVHPTPVAVKTESPTLAVEEQTKSLKRKVAIARFTNETRYGQSFFVDKDDNKIGKQAMDILSAKLFATGKFLMLERADMAQLQKELSMEGEGKKISTSADYLILGSITEFGRKDASDVGVFSRVKKQEAFAKVHIRLVDVQTGQIVSSEEGRGTAFSEAGSVLGVGGKAGYDSSLNDAVIEAAIADLISNIIENMLDKPWRAYILAEEHGNLIISGGKSQNIRAGDQFKVLARGRMVRNPQTNMMIELPGKQLATITVLSTLGDTTENEISLCEISAGDLSRYISAGTFQDLYVEIQQ
jgi:curli biogenesis system outer membrane secretion channel CsgG